MIRTTGETHNGELFKTSQELNNSSGLLIYYTLQNNHGTFSCIFVYLYVFYLGHCRLPKYFIFSMYDKIIILKMYFSIVFKKK